MKEEGRGEVVSKEQGKRKEELTREERGVKKVRGERRNENMRGKGEMERRHEGGR